MMLSSRIISKLGMAEENLVDKFRQEVYEVFNTSVGLDDLMYLPVAIDPATEFQDCVSSLIRLTGTYNGVVSLHMPSDLATTATRCMRGVKTVNDDDIDDAMGEIANMIAGSFKAHLSRSGADIRLSLPWVMYGKEYIVSLSGNSNHIAVRFATEDDWFLVTAAFEAV